MCAILVLFPEFVGGLLGVDAWILGVVGVVLFGLILFLLAHGLKCPGCRINLFWYGIAHAKYANWLDWILKQSVCPKCGYPCSQENQDSHSIQS
jgi:hypothetical protein